MSTLSVTISREGLDLPDLVIGDGSEVTPEAPFWVPADGISTPDLTWRYSYAPDSPWLSGKKLLSAVLEASSIPMSVMVGPVASQADLEAAKDELTEAVSQFVYTTTITVDGVPAAWSCDPAYPQWGTLTHAYAEQRLARAALVIPVNP